MKPIKTKDAEKILKDNGFVHVRDSKHRIFACGSVTTCLAHSNEQSPGMTRQIFKAISQAKSQIQAVAA